MDLESLLASVVPPGEVEGGVVGAEWFDWDALPLAPETQPCTFAALDPVQAVSSASFRLNNAT